jgi:hypothetical protein
MHDALDFVLRVPDDVRAAMKDRIRALEEDEPYGR